MQNVVTGKTSDMMSIRKYFLTLDSPDMLDAFIIEKIQRERELHESGRESLRIEVPQDHERDQKGPVDEAKQKRGIEIVDFNI